MALGYVVLTIVFAYPLSVHLGDHVLSQSTDTNLYIWTLAWDAHAFLHQPFSIFEANIFFPLRHTLAYSENLIGSALFAAPVLWLTRNPVLAMNLAGLVTAPLCALGAYLLARSVGISPLGSALCGLIYGFSPPRFFRLDQLHLTNVQWIPFALALAHRYATRRRKSDLRWAVAFFTLQALTSGHGAAFLSVAIVVLIAYRGAFAGRLQLEPLRSAPQRHEPLEPAPLNDLPQPALFPLAGLARDFGVAGALLLLPAALILLPYRAAQVEMGLRRNLENWHVPWTSFLASPAHVQQYVIGRFLAGAHVNESAGAFLFPGFVTLLLAAVGIIERKDPMNGWRRAALGLNAVIACSLAIAVYGSIAGSLRLRLGSVVLLSARQPWRAWLVCAVTALLRIAIARRLPVRAGVVRLSDDHLAAPVLPVRRFPKRFHANDATFYTLLLALSLWLSIGPPYGLWQYVYWWPGLNFIRAPSRFMILGVLALGVLAGFGFDSLTARSRPAGRASTAAIVTVLLLIEFVATPVGIVRQDPVIPSVDRWLAGRPAPFVVAEVPVFESSNITLREWRQSIYMLHSMAHWQKTVHGYSGLLPAFSEELYGRLASFPDRASLEALSKIGVDYVVVHADAYAPADWLDVQQRIKQFPELRLEHVEENGQVYSVRRP